MQFTTQEIADLLEAIADAQGELCTGPGFPEATAYDARLEALAERLRGYEQQAPLTPDPSKCGYPNHPGVAGPCHFPDGSRWNGFQWTRPPDSEQKADSK